MEKQASKRSMTKRGDNEALLAVFLICIIVFALILTIVLLVRTFSVEVDITEETTDQETTTDTESDVPEPSYPVFSGGVLPAKPQNSTNTQTITQELASDYAVLVKIDTGEIVASLQSDVKFSPASMTKVMTLIVACEKLTEAELDQKLTMTSEWYDYSRDGAYHDSTLHGIDVNDEYKIRDLLYGIGMRSASDCVVPIIFYLAGSEEAFVALMNQKVAELGLQNTRFDNAIGHDSANNYTTAEDMAVIMAYAMQSDLIRDILGKTSYKSEAAGYNSQGLYVPSFNFSFYSSLFGDHDASRMTAYKDQYGVPFVLSTAKLLAGKTGWTPDNYCLVSYATSNTDQSEYVLVLGKADKKYETMKDVKDIFDAYIK